MKTFGFSLGLFCALTLWPAALQAGLPQPDMLIYGTITVGGKAVSSKDSNVVVEARRTLGGRPVASYRMGSASAAGTHFYQLRLALESTPIQREDASRVGETLFLVVRDETGIRDQRGFRIADWGAVARVDFGPPLDTNASGVPDGWEELHGIRDLQADPDRDGLSNLAEFLAGTNPNDANDAFKLSVTRTSRETLITFPARRAEGVGYEGRTRIYALESAPDPVRGPWQAVPEYSRIIGNNQTVVFGAPAAANPPRFYRARISLEPRP